MLRLYILHPSNIQPITISTYRVFGWRVERARSEPIRSRGCLDGRADGCVGSRREYSPNIGVHLIPQNLRDGADPLGFKLAFVTSVFFRRFCLLHCTTICKDGCRGGGAGAVSATCCGRGRQHSEGDVVDSDADGRDDGVHVDKQPHAGSSPIRAG
jgi:hypothetical protein